MHAYTHMHIPANKEKTFRVVFCIRQLLLWWRNTMSQWKCPIGWRAGDEKKHGEGVTIEDALKLDRRKDYDSFMYTNK